jgi:hypothetical protein
VLENVEIVLRLYDRSGRKGGREERRKGVKGIAEKGGDSVKRPPSLSTEQGGADRPGWRPLTRNRREAGSCSAHPRITRAR